MAAITDSADNVLRACVKYGSTYEKALSLLEKTGFPSTIEKVIEWYDTHKKPVYEMRDVQVIPAESIWDKHERVKGKFVIKGYVVYPDGTNQIHKTRTALIVKADIEAGTFETLNSVYKVVV